MSQRLAVGLHGLILFFLTPHWFGLADDGMIFGGLTKSSKSRIVAGGVFALQVIVANQGDTDAEALLEATVVSFPGLQSCRKVALGPGEQQQLDLFVQLPKEVGRQEYIEVDVNLKANYQGQEVLLKRNGRPLTDRLRLPVEQPSENIALALEPEPKAYPEWFWPSQEKPYASYELAMATRIDTGYSRVATGLHMLGMPLNLAEWENLNLLVISDDTLFEEAAAVESVRRFLAAGGRCWVMLDRVSCESIRPLLGRGQICEFVDEVELNEFTVDIASTAVDYSSLDRQVSQEEPIVMKRVLQSGGTVTHSIDGWPAAIRMDVGPGELVMTTLGSHGWMETRTQQRNSDPVYQSVFAMREWALQFATNVNSARVKDSLPPELEYPLSHIGHPIVSRGWIVAALGTFCLLLGVVGLWRIVAGDLGIIGAVAPVLACIAGVGLLAAKTWVRGDIQECVAKLQRIEVSQDGSLASAHEQAAMFLDSVEAMDLQCEFDGRATTNPLNTGGITRYMVDDFQEWKLTNDDWPTGVWRYQTDYVLDANQLMVTAELSDQGCKLKLPEQMEKELEDSVLAFVAGGPMLCSADAGGLIADGSITVGEQRWIAGTLISDEQQRRMEIYRQLFGESEQRSLKRTLYGWTSLWDGPQWDRDLPQRGAALVSLPVDLKRPPPGTQVLVPHGLVEFRQSSTEMGRTTAYSEATGKWRKDLTIAIDRKFQFVLPDEVVPFEAESITLDLDIKAPYRVVTLQALTRSGPVELARLVNPSVPWRQTFQEASILEELADGTLELQFQVSERTDVEDGSESTSIVAWQVDTFHATVRGRTASGVDMP